MEIANVILYYYSVGGVDELKKKSPSFIHDLFSRSSLLRGTKKKRIIFYYKSISYIYIHIYYYAFLFYA